MFQAFRKLFSSVNFVPSLSLSLFSLLLSLSHTRKVTGNTCTPILSCLAILVILGFCWTVQPMRQVAPALCSAERGWRKAVQMASSTMFSHWFHHRSQPDRSPYLCGVLPVQWKSHVNKERKCTSWWFELGSLRQTWGPETDNQNSSTNSFNTFPFRTHTFCC